jgi:trimeric autotransporter adhesin
MLFWFFQNPAIPRKNWWCFLTVHIRYKHTFNTKSTIMKTLTQNSKNHGLKISCSILLLFVMTFGLLAQERVHTEEIDLLKTESFKMDLPSPDKSSGYRLNVAGSDALIHGHTIGRGGGSSIYNTTLGMDALIGNTAGTWNTAIGFRALYANTTGSQNAAIGGGALRNNTTGSYNTACGDDALRNNTTGFGNTASGDNALYFNTTGSRNTASGHDALYSNTTGSRNTASGHAALGFNTTGSANVAIGWRALYRNTDRSNLVAVGDSALYWNGYNATHADHAKENTALGSKALFANTTGSYNTANGYQALFSNSTGYANTANGFRALYCNISGEHNTASGIGALFSNTTGSFNTASGHYALFSNTTGSHNTAIGAQALVDNTTGVGNTAIGNFAGRSEAVINQGTFLGHYAWVSVNNISNVSAIGFQAMANASNQVRIGNSLVTSIGGYANWTNLSDGDYKRNVEEDVAGLDFILKLRPVSYNIDVHRLAANLEEDISRTEDGNKATAVPDETTLKSRDEKAAIRYTGFIAQEVEATVNDLGVAFSGVDAPVNKNGYYGLRYADFVVPLVRAVQEQQAQIEALSPEGIDALLEELIDLRQANEHLLAAEASLRAENESIRGQIKDILSLLESYGLEIQDCCQQNTTRSDPDDGRLQPISGNARLEQNTPNPFRENTLIRYFLPEGGHRAQIIVTDMAGLQVMAFPLEHQGAGQVLIHGGTLSPGTYVYTLAVDGRKVDSKRMVLL